VATAVAAVATSATTAATIATAAAITAVATLAAAATSLATAAIRGAVTATATASAVAAAATMGTEQASVGPFFTAHQGDADNREKNRDAKHDKPIHPRILQKRLTGTVSETVHFHLAVAFVFRLSATA
jgi:hypothetical protein